MYAYVITAGKSRGVTVIVEEFIIAIDCLRGIQGTRNLACSLSNPFLDRLRGEIMATRPNMDGDSGDMTGKNPHDSGSATVCQ